MRNIVSTIIRLQGKASRKNVCRITREDGREVQIWGLSDKSTLILEGKSNRYRGKPAMTIELVTKSDLDFQTVVKREKYVSQNLNQLKQVSLCI